MPQLGCSSQQGWPTGHSFPAGLEVVPLLFPDGYNDSWEMFSKVQRRGACLCWGAPRLTQEPEACSALRLCIYLCNIFFSIVNEIICWKSLFFFYPLCMRPGWLETYIFIPVHVSNPVQLHDFLICGFVITMDLLITVKGSSWSHRVWGTAGVYFVLCKEEQQGECTEVQF